MAKHRQCLENPATGFQRVWLLRRPMDAETPAITVADCFLQHVAEVTVIDHHLVESGGGQPFKMMLYQRFAAHINQGFGYFVGQRAQAFAAAGSKNHHTHYICSGAFCNTRFCSGSNSGYRGKTSSR
ncbi:hypothetical protein D3C83_36420 [compost metagenome]